VVLNIFQEELLATGGLLSVFAASFGRFFHFNPVRFSVLACFCRLSQVFLQPDGDTVDIEGNPLPRLVYVSREKRPGYDHNKKAGAMNALIRASALITNAPFILNLDCDHYVNNCNAFREVRTVCIPVVPLDTYVCHSSV
jgi:hypothetical protein